MLCLYDLALKNNTQIILYSNLGHFVKALYKILKLFFTWKNKKANKEIAHKIVKSALFLYLI